MSQQVVRYAGYDVIYETLDSYEPSEDSAPVCIKWIDRYRLQDGYKLWRVGASYAKHLRPSCYFIVARKRMEAVGKLLARMDYMKFISETTMLTDEQAEEVLTQPQRFVIF